MGNYIKINGEWIPAFTAYIKTNDAWVKCSSTQLSTYVENKVFLFGGTGTEGHTLIIAGPSQITGESCSFSVIYDGLAISPSSVTWEVVTGGMYAVLGPDGQMIILALANGNNVTIRATYSNGVTAEKNLVVTYLAGATSETETESETVVDPETGQTTETTTTTTTTTDANGNVTTATTTSETVTNQDGTSSTTESEEVINPDGSSSTNSSTTNYDEHGNTTSTVESEVINNADGSSQSSTAIVNYDENGDVSGSSTNETTTNADGSSASSTTNYNAGGDPTDQQNIATDTTGNVDTQDVEFDENGDPTVTGYVIDTEASDGSGKDITGSGVDTEFIPFQFTEGFTMQLRFKSIAGDQPKPPVVEDTEDTGTNYLYNIMSAKSTTKVNNVWPGFDIRWAISKTGSSSTFQFRRTLVGESGTNSTDIKDKHLNNVFDFIITYNPAESSRKFSVHDNLANDYIVSVNKQLQNDLNLEVTLGYALNMQNQPYRYSNVTIYDFNVNRLDSTLSVANPVITCDGTRVSITCSTAGAKIYYMAEGSSKYDLYTSPILISADIIMYAYAVLQHKISSVVTQQCIYDDGSPDEPVITCDGEYVTITCATQDASIYYRIGQSGNFSEYTVPFAIVADVTIDAYSEFDGLTSDTVSQYCDYDDGRPDTPVITCDGEYITMSCSTPNAVIYYSFDAEEYNLYHSTVAFFNDTSVYAYSELNSLTSDITSAYCEYAGTAPIHDYSEDYLTFSVLSSGTISWKALGSGAVKTIEYSKNNGEWTSLTATSVGTTISVSQGDSVRFRGTNTKYCANNKNNYSGFEGGTATYNIEGNIMSLIYGDNFLNQTTISEIYAFCSIFKKSNVISAENLILPATTLTNHCYRAMFSNATHLEVPPALPATTLAQYCYWYMFENCAITTAPDLLAETLIAYSYGYMFTGCTSLNYIKCLATTISATSCLQNWVNNVAASGTFIKDGNTSWSTGSSGIPTNWVVYNNEILQSPVISCDGEHITITCETPDSSIYYKLDDAVNYSEYTSIITITEDTTVYAYSSKGDNQSPVIEQECIYVEHMYKFAGLEIASGPLCYDSSDGYIIKDSWNYDSYNSSYGKVAGSSYFNFIEIGELFDHVGFDTSSGSINNVLDPFDGWRLPTQSDCAAFVSTGTSTRVGSTVNELTNKHFAIIQLSDASVSGNQSPIGLLLFPDGEIITGSTLTNIDNTSINTGLTLSQLNNYLSQGCAFIPCFGYYQSDWQAGGSVGNYWTSNENNSERGQCFYFNGSNISTSDYANKQNYYYTVWLVKDSTYGIKTPFEASNKSLTTWEI